MGGAPRGLKKCFPAHRVSPRSSHGRADAAIENIAAPTNRALTVIGSNDPSRTKSAEKAGPVQSFDIPERLLTRLRHARRLPSAAFSCGGHPRPTLITLRHRFHID